MTLSTTAPPGATPGEVAAPGEVAGVRGEVRQSMLRMLHASLVTQAVAVAAELGLADLTAGGPRRVEELATDTGTDPDALHRLLRALASQGVFTEVAPRTYGGTALSDALRDGVEGSLRNWARLWGDTQRHAALGGLLHSVRTGEPAFAHLHGADWWSRLAEDPARAAVFAAAMGDLSRELHAATVEAHDLRGVRSLVDVGGGRGHLAAALLRRYPDLKVTVFDRPDVVVHAAEVLSAAGVAGRARLAAGDFFAEVPAHGQVYLMSMILHDWDDAQSATILRNVRRAMGPGDVLLVVDAILPAGDTPHDGKLRDLIMLTLHPGRERTEAEFAALLAGAGLRLRESKAVAASTGLLVAEVAA
ncbi:methyltransferase [Dactylosporangium sp. NPDC000521]|uniref:methyltransferase n=1 Tax=Dactylosporangium sp. NPDC000521 TaxID=3363975 RepID=UPI003696FCA6